jgi:CspA family cold shock protein
MAKKKKIKGTVKLFNVEKGHGLIKPDSGEKDVYFDRSAIIAGSGFNFKSLSEGLRVEFDVVGDTKGPSATNLEICGGTHGGGKGE